MYIDEDGRFYTLDKDYNRIYCDGDKEDIPVELPSNIIKLNKHSSARRQ